MELTAAIKALEATAPGSTVLVYTGSQLMQQGMTGWVHNGWHADTGQLVENEDLWEKLRHLDEERRVRWEWLDVPMAEATAGPPWHPHIHALLDAERHQATVHTPGAQAGSQADETGIRVTIEETEREAHMQHMEPILRARQGTQPGTGDRQQALMAEGQTLEQRWAVVHEEVLHLDQEWQRLLSRLTNQVEAGRNGQSPSWADGALMFNDMDKHAARMSGLAQEALQTCHHYALTLQRMLDAMAEG
jgi:hypothetical protein